MLTAMINKTEMFRRQKAEAISI